MGTEDMEEPNICGVNQLDVDVRLPPRKRLLAGLKKQSCNCASPSSPFSPISNGYSTHIRNLLVSDSRSTDLSPEEIVDSARSAAQAAIKVAAAARAAAEEKAAVAAKAAAAAKSALETVASVSEKFASTKNKPKKHVPVKLLYKNQQSGKNSETDEELAQRLHRAMNSSPRISKNSPNGKDYKDEKCNILSSVGKSRVFNGVVICEGNLSSFCDSNAEAAEVDFEVPIPRVENVIEVDENSLEPTENGCSSMDGFSADEDVEAPDSEEKYWREFQATFSTGRKRGRIKQKKLLLSQCTIRDRENPKEETKAKCTSMPLLTAKSSTECEMSADAISIWKGKEFKAPQCFAESKIVQSVCSNASMTTGAAMVEVDQ